MEQRTDAGLDAFVGGAPPLPPGDHSDLSVGEVLRRNRLFYEKSIADVESVLRIRAAYLEALERGEFNRLPGRVYAIGFVRSYAEYLGLDPDAMIRKFKAQAGGYSVKPEFTLPVPASESRAPGRWVVVSSAACAVVAFSLWLIFSQTSRTVAPLLPAPEPVAAAPVSAPVSTPPESAPALSAPVEAVLPAAQEGQMPPAVPDEKAGRVAAAIEPAVGLAVAPSIEAPLTAPESSTDISFTPSATPASQVAPEAEAAPVPESAPEPDV
ncbi:MAG TPA: helix-turn-helix domain-containing protein, partial [Alphaproteobacteria bacterium]|nr:helix-turn-helix domain-containing protein [Alphaproteobacteria bacterium]